MQIRSLLVLALLSCPGSPAAMGPDTTPAPAATLGGAAYSEAVRLIEAAKFAAAAALLERVVAIDAANADAWSRLGFCRRKLGDSAGALMAYEKALKVQPQHLGANEYLGELYIEQGRIDLARDRLGVLADACGACEEYLELRALIEAHGAARAPGGRS